MNELENSQESTKTTEELAVVEEVGSSSKSTVNATFNQQNNYHLTQNIDLDKLTMLSEKAPSLAEKVMSLYEKQQEHNINIDNRILTIEETEQKARITERPYQRKFAFRSLYFAMGLSIVSLAAAGYFASLEYPWLAGTAIYIPIGVAVANMLGYKAAGQTEQKKDNTNETSDNE